MFPNSQAKEVTLKDYLVVLRRRIWIVLACFFPVAVLSTIRAFNQIPLYIASSKILIESDAPRFVPQNEFSPTSYFNKEYFQSQINIITSRQLARKVVENLIASGDATFTRAEEPESQIFLEGVKVVQLPGTQILTIGYVSPDPVKAAKFANTLTNIYIQEDIQKRKGATETASGWLETQLVEVQKRLENSEAALVEFLQKNQIISMPEIDKKEQYTLDALKGDKLKVESEIAELSKRYKAKHPKLIALNTRLDSLNNGIKEETKKMLDLNAKLLQYNLLKREVESNKNAYEVLVGKTKAAEVVKEYSNTNIRIIDLADVPREPFSPNRRRDITAGVFLGLVLGVGLAFFSEYLDSTVKTAEDVEAYVRLPFLGYVPSVKQEVKTDKDIDVASFKLPHSRIAEAYRSIRTSIIFSAPEDRPLKTILITSAAPQEGKTTVSINLGIVFANANEKTVLIESDMRKPRIANSLGIENKQGLSSFLAGASNLDAVIKQTMVANLFLIPSGPKPPNPAELLISAKTRHLLEELKSRFDRIIIDSPPVITVTDTAILANTVDGVIDVVRAGFLNIEIILRGRQRLYEAKSRIIGVILNNVNVKKEDSYYYYHYYYAEDSEKGKKA